MRYGLLLLIFISFFIISCKEGNEEIFNYPFTTIPEYTALDYYNLLSINNNEIKYNSICNLFYYSNELSNKYYDVSSDKNSKEYLLSKDIYEKIKNDLNKSNDRMIIAASLKFLQEFMHLDDYNEIKKLALKIKNNSFIVNYELENILLLTSDNKNKIDKKIIEKFLNNRSWVISKKAHLLINKSEDEELRNGLLKKYDKIKNEYDKLLILTAFSDNYSYDVFDKIFIKEINGENLKIKSFIFKIINNCKEQGKVNEWIINNNRSLKKDDLEKIANSYKDLSDNSSIDLVIKLIKDGFEPDNVLYENLIGINNNIRDKQELKDKINDLLNEIQSRDNLKTKYNLVLKGIKKEINPDFIKENNLIADNYINNFERISRKYNANNEKITEYIKLLEESLKGDMLKQLFY